MINEDQIQPGKEFGRHSHQDMEIITYVLSGQLEHRDSLGNGSIIRPGDMQRMSAGTGIAHSEFNASAEEPVHLLQIWITPNQLNITPSYAQELFDLEAKQGKLCLVASPDGQNNSVCLHQDALLYASVLDAGDQLDYFCHPGRGLWLQLVRGGLKVNEIDLQVGDGLAITETSALTFAATAPQTEFLLFDLA